MKEKKDLAEKYLTKAQENAIYFKDINFFNGPLYQENDIKAAFNAGRESVVERVCLNWSGKGMRLSYMQLLLLVDITLTISEYGYYDLTERKFHSLLVAF